MAACFPPAQQALRSHLQLSVLHEILDKKLNSLLPSFRLPLFQNESVQNNESTSHLRFNGFTPRLVLKRGSTSHLHFNGFTSRLVLKRGNFGNGIFSPKGKGKVCTIFVALAFHAQIQKTYHSFIYIICLDFLFSFFFTFFFLNYFFFLESAHRFKKKKKRRRQKLSHFKL